MAWLRDLNLIHLFNFYLWLMFLLSTYRRLGQYRSILALVGAVPGRWPRLFALVRRHRGIFLTWSTILPGVLALLLIVVQGLASYYLWPEAGRPPDGLTVGWLIRRWPLAVFTAVVGLCMVSVDLYATITAGELDRELMRRYFDQAEYWLRSWTAPVVRVFTLGYINPRRMVTLEVRNALVQASQLMNSTLWWVSLQVAVRVAFGLCLWVAYAVEAGA